MLRILVLLCWVIFVPVAMAQDPVKTDGDKYKALMENERVRVLEYRDRPGEKTSMHHHPDFVLYALTPFKRKLTLGDGKTIIREFKTGDVLWSPAQAHIGENIGTTETHVIIVELKENAPGLHEEKKAPSRPADK
jgi:quercetin dioxygenase-like cupin family protein